MKVRPRALLSIHDVTPDHLARVLAIAELLDGADVPPAMLLVVPGLGWRSRQVDAVRALVDRGYELAGHGWVHKAPPPSDLHHRIHAAVISRDQAEHLSRGPDELVKRVSDCHAWFASVDLPSPRLYVPPAWALGTLGSNQLRDLPFDWFESLSGFLAPRAGRRRTLPLTGYEADTIGREAGLRTWNGLNVALGRLTARPVRISIHPRDLTLRLGAALRTDVTSRRFTFVKTGDWLEAEMPVPPRGYSASTTSPVASPSTSRT